MFKKIGVDFGVTSWEVDPTLPKRKRPIERHSHNMDHGRMDMKERKAKKGRKF